MAYILLRNGLDRSRGSGTAVNVGLMRSTFLVQRCTQRMDMQAQPLVAPTLPKPRFKRVVTKFYSVCQNTGRPNTSPMRPGTPNIDGLRGQRVCGDPSDSMSVAPR